MSKKRSRTVKTTAESLSLDTPFDRLTALACGVFDAPYAMVSVIEGERIFFRANVSLSDRSMPRLHSATQMLVEMGPDGVLFIADATQDERLRHHPMVAGGPGLRAFIGMTVVNAAGKAVGAIGVMDVKPREAPSEAAMANLKLMAQMAGDIVSRTEEGRRQSERLELLRLVEQMAGIGQWSLDVATRMVTWSDEVYRIHGVEREGFDPSLDDALRFYHEDDRGGLADAIAHGFETGEGYRMRVRLIRADGEERLVETHAESERAPDGRILSMYGVFQDVTEQERLYREAATNERRYRLLADNTGDVITRVDMNGASKYISPAIEQLLGWRYEDMSGQSTDYVHPDDRAILLEAIREAVRTKGLTRLQHRALHKDGRTVWVDCSFKAIVNSKGEATGAVVIIRDFEERRKMEQALVEARDRAEAAARAKSEFLANMSHELRTPLTSVVGFSGLLLGSPALGLTERRYAERIATASDALLGVINDILDYSKLEAGAVALEPRAFDPRAMAEAAAAIVESQCLAKGLTLAVEVAPDTPAVLMGDEGRLRQVTLNFLANAAKFTEAGRITLKLGWSEGRLRLAVNDTGIGIAADKVDGLFERFTQADNSTTRVYGGTGLGLSISRRLADLMGGRIGVESRQGEGSTFWFEAPLMVAEAASASIQDRSVEAAPQGLRVLVADDAAANRELVSAILGGLGLEVETVSDGAQAVEAARGGTYDLILMDVHMPVMDGLDATRLIRAMEGAAGRKPIIALTANVQPEQVEHCRAAGMDDHVGKPIEVAELVRVMSRLLEQGAARAENAVA